MAKELTSLTCKDAQGRDVTFTISDPDAVNCCAQQLTNEQKAQARANIGAISTAEAQEMIEDYVDEAILGGEW